MVDKIMKKIKKILKDNDGFETLDEQEYEKIGKIISILVHSEPEIRKIFYKKINSLVRAMAVRIDDKLGFFDNYDIFDKGKNDKILN